MSSHIAIVNNTGLGHVLPTLDTVAELVRRGHRVTYATGGAATRRVAATGAEALEFDSVLAKVDLSAIDTSGESHRLLPLQVRESEAILKAVDARFAGQDKPDLVVYDTTVYHAGRILARKWDVPAAVFCATLSSNEHFSLLDKFVEVSGTALPRTHPSLREFGTRLLRLLAAHGQSDQSLEEFVGRKEDLHLASYPRSFQFMGDTFDERHVFLGPYTGRTAGPSTWTPPADGQRLLVVSLGTSVTRRPGFFKLCVDALSGLPWRVLLAVPDADDAAELEPLPPNVEVHTWLPLHEVLAHADVFLCHGGLGSILGSLAHGTPVVVVPDCPERKVNALRVAELGVGRDLPEGALSPQRLRGVVREVAADPDVRDAARALAEDIAASGGGSRGADAIEDHLKRASDGPGRGSP